MGIGWKRLLRGMMRTNLSVWMGEDPHPMYQRCYVAAYDRLRDGAVEEIPARPALSREGTPAPSRIS